MKRSSMASEVEDLTKQMTPVGLLVTDVADEGLQHRTTSIVIRLCAPDLALWHAHQNTLSLCETSCSCSSVSLWYINCQTWCVGESTIYMHLGTSSLALSSGVLHLRVIWCIHWLLPICCYCREVRIKGKQELLAESLLVKKEDLGDVNDFRVIITSRLVSVSY